MLHGDIAVSTASSSILQDLKRPIDKKTENGISQETHGLKLTTRMEIHMYLFVCDNEIKTTWHEEKRKLIRGFGTRREILRRRSDRINKIA